MDPRDISSSGGGAEEFNWDEFNSWVAQGNQQAESSNTSSDIYSSPFEASMQSTENDSTLNVADEFLKFLETNPNQPSNDGDSNFSSHEWHTDDHSTESPRLQDISHQVLGHNNSHIQEHSNPLREQANIFAGQSKFYMLNQEANVQKGQNLQSPSFADQSLEGGLRAQLGTALDQALTGISGPNEKRVILKALERIDPEERADVLRHATPVFQNIADGKGRADILIRVSRLSEKSIAMLEKCQPLFQGLNTAKDIVDILKDIHNLLPLEPKQLEELLDDCKTLLQDIPEGENRLNLLFIAMKIPTVEGRKSFSKNSTELLKGITDNHQKNVIFETVSNLTHNAADILKDAQPFLEGASNGYEIAKMLRAVDNFPPSQRKEILDTLCRISEHNNSSPKQLVNSLMAASMIFKDAQGDLDIMEIFDSTRLFSDPEAHEAILNHVELFNGITNIQAKIDLAFTLKSELSKILNKFSGFSENNIEDALVRIPPERRLQTLETISNMKSTELNECLRLVNNKLNRNSDSEQLDSFMQILWLAKNDDEYIRINIFRNILKTNKESPETAQALIQALSTLVHDTNFQIYDLIDGLKKIPQNEWQNILDASKKLCEDIPNEKRIGSLIEPLHDLLTGLTPEKQNEVIAQLKPILAIFPEAHQRATILQIFSEIPIDIRPNFIEEIKVPLRNITDAEDGIRIYQLFLDLYKEPGGLDTIAEAKPFMQQMNLEYAQDIENIYILIHKLTKNYSDIVPLVFPLINNLPEEQHTYETFLSFVNMLLETDPADWKGLSEALANQPPGDRLRLAEDANFIMANSPSQAVRSKIILNNTVSEMTKTTLSNAAEAAKIPPLTVEIKNSTDLNDLLNIFDSINFTNPSQSYYRDPLKLKDEGSPTTIANLRGAINSGGLIHLVDCITNRKSYTAVPRDNDEKESFYNQLESGVRNIINNYNNQKKTLEDQKVVAQEQNDQEALTFIDSQLRDVLDTFQGYVLTLAEGGCHCASRWEGEVSELLDLQLTGGINVKSKTEIDVKEEIHSAIDKLKSGTIAGMIYEIRKEGYRSFDVSHANLFFIRSVAAGGYAIPGGDKTQYEDTLEHMGHAGKYDTADDIIEGFTKLFNPIAIAESTMNNLNEFMNKPAHVSIMGYMRTIARDELASRNPDSKAKIDAINQKYDPKIAIVESNRNNESLHGEEIKKELLTLCKTEIVSRGLAMANEKRERRVKAQELANKIPTKLQELTNTIPAILKQIPNNIIQELANKVSTIQEELAKKQPNIPQVLADNIPIILQELAKLPEGAEVKQALDLINEVFALQKVFSQFQINSFDSQISKLKTNRDGELEPIYHELLSSAGYVTFENVEVTSTIKDPITEEEEVIINEVEKKQLTLDGTVALLQNLKFLEPK